jgi:hypothetical protein
MPQVFQNAAFDLALISCPDARFSRDTRRGGEKDRQGRIDEFLHNFLCCANLGRSHSFASLRGRQEMLALRQLA